jgi:hypothetical protein
MQWPSSWRATDSKSYWLAPMLLLPPKNRFGDAETRAFQVATMFWTGITIEVALLEVGSMHTETLSVPPEPV